MMDGLQDIARSNVEDFIIDMDDLELEKKPFAVGGSGQIFRGVYSGCEVAVKVKRNSVISAANISHTASSVLGHVLANERKGEEGFP